MKRCKHIYGYWKIIGGGHFIKNKQQIRKTFDNQSTFKFCPNCGESIERILNQAIADGPGE